MEKVVKVLAVQRRSFDQVFNDILNLFAQENTDKIAIFSKINILEQKIQVLMDLHRQMVDFLLDDEDALNKEISTADEYSDKYFKAKLLADNLSNKNITADSLSQCSNETRRKLKLPKIEFRKFGGEIKEWLLFWSQFQRVNDDKDIAPEDKFQYLIQASIPNSKARQLIDSYPPSAENYQKVIESLKKRFGRKDLLVEFYVRELLKLILNNLSTQNNLSILYDKMESQLRALETLDVTSDTCAAILYPLVESCLPEDLIRVWQRSSLYDSDSTLKDRLDKLMNFLRKEVENEERISLATSGFDIQGKFKKKNDSQKHHSSLPTAAGLINNKLHKKCHFCSGNHPSELCTEAKKWTLFDRKKKLLGKACCYICLNYGHISKKCRVSITCTLCGGRHHAIMCPKSEDSDPKESVMSTNVENSLSNSSYSEVFLQTLVVNLNGFEKSRTARIIFDTGSQKSYITKSAAEEMGYNCLRQEEIIHALFGGSRTNVVKHNCYRIKLSDLKNEYACNFEALDQSIICSNVNHIRRGPWINKLQAVGIEITDVREGPIDILIGADIAGKLFTGNRYELECGLVAIETLLGWTLMGKLKENHEETPKSSIVMSMFSKYESITDLWSLDVLGISDPTEKRTQKEIEEFVMSQFLKNIVRQEDGRYEVCLSWIEDHPPLPSNYETAIKRLESLLKKLDSDGLRDQYAQVFTEWQTEGIIEEVPTSDLLEEGHYLPHRHVVKESSATTKIRPVFDASSRQKNQPSLNQCLEKGINLIELIPSLLMRFRYSRFGLIADIKKAFLQISLNRKERDFLRFLWLDDKGMLKIYRHTRVVFGVSCSPFLLGAVIECHLKRCLENSKNSDIITQLLKSFYVDNCVVSLDTREEIQNFIDVSTRLFADAKFDLRGWEHSAFDGSSNDDNSFSSLLGLSWSKNTDTLQLASEWFRNIHTERITKRVILSIAHRIFDPIGFSCPVSLYPKILLQKTWELKTGWDTEVQKDIKEGFLKWFEEIPILFTLKVPRWLFNSIEGKNHCSLHVFCDGSQLAYATAIFMRSETCNGVNVQLVQAKSRVSPVKRMTIPRLELLAATIGARLSRTVTDSIDSSILVYYWSDSTTVLAWIKDEENWKPFVWNRVKEIRSLTNPKAWFHVPGDLNPADLPSRGCSPRQLIKSKWWEGPTWLRKSPKYWPNPLYTRDEKMIESEKNKGVSLNNVSTSIDFSWYHERISKYSKIIRVLGWIRRFIVNCRSEKEKNSDEELSLEEVQFAEKCVMRFVQDEAFNGPDDSQLKSFCSFTDENGILRTRTMVSERTDFPDFRFPIILPSKHPVVSKLIYETHLKSLHVGVQGLLSLLRERFWIIRGRKSVKSVISKCLKCRRFNSRRIEVPTIALPENRVREVKVFEVIGVDLAGPLYIRNGEKAWICLYTCAIYRAVHLELLSSLSTDVFLQSFRRFVARRGRPSTVYSDNGTNFVGAENAFSQLDWKMITAHSTAERIAWKYNPPTAAWWGGWWERLIGIMKDLLRKVLGKASLTYEELSTILCDCESVLNPRPLTYIPGDSKDLIHLTPAMFLKEISESGVPDLDAVERSDLKKHLRYRMKLKDDLRRRFRNEYLGQLKLSSEKRKQREIKVGEIVLIGTDNTKRMEWPLAYVQELIPGRDNKTRLVKLKTTKGIVLRPLQRVYPLEMNCADDLDLTQISDKAVSTRETESKETEETQENDNGCSENPEPLPITTRYGRRVKTVQRFS